jgi:general secretion pathway protein D
MFGRLRARSGVAVALALLTGCQSLSQGQLVQEDAPAQADAAAAPRSAPRPQRPPAEERAAPPPRPRLYPGTGVFVRAPDAPARPGAVPEGDVTLNFVDADVREVVRSVLGDVLHLNFSIDPKVQATVTVQTSRPLRREDVLPTLEEVLRASGLALTQHGDIYRVVPLDEAARGAAVPSGRPPQSYSIQVVPLKFVSAAELQRTLDPFVPKGAAIRVDAARNMLIVSGTGADIAALGELIATFDVDFLAGMSFGIFPLQNGSAKSVATELGSILGAGSGAPLGGMLRFVPLERINSVLVISPQRAYLRQAGSWIERLDRGDEDTPRIFEYRVQNSRAVDLARVLSQLFSSGQVRVVDTGVAPGQTPVQLSSAGFGQNGGGNGASPSPAPPPPAGAPPLPLPLPLSQPAQDQPPPAPQTPQAGDGGTPSVGRGDDDLAPPHARIVADEKNNTLVIYAKPRDYRMIEDALKKLDVVPLQVLIEATIAEVTLNHDLQYGVQWFLKAGTSSFTLSNDKTGIISSVFPGFNYVLKQSNVNVVLNALSAVTDVNVVSSPQLLVLDHHVATLQVGDQVPIPIQQAQSTLVPGAPLINTVEFRDTGVILRVSPRVNSNGLITLDIAQEVSDVTKTTTSNIDAPTIQQRRIQSTVTVQDGETVALGGLIRENRTNSRNGVPGLGSIPLLGTLFSSTDRQKDRTELLILLSPRVVHDAAEARTLTEELRGRLHALEPLAIRVR